MASVVLAKEYADDTSNHPFRMDPNYQQSHKVMPDETLGHILQAYYGGSGLNMKFVEMAIVQFNKHAFVRGNPNFLYADKTLHLPSVNRFKVWRWVKKKSFSKVRVMAGIKMKSFSSVGKLLLQAWMLSTICTTSCDSR